MGLRTTIALAAILAAVSSSAALAQQNQVEADKTMKAASGNWKAPQGGTCDTPYMKSGDLNKTVRGEGGMKVALTNRGKTVDGTLILAGAREGQIVNPTTDKMMFLLEPQDGDKLHVMALGEPVADWGDLVLDLCPGTRK
jgi:hypothetical protein